MGSHTRRLRSQHYILIEEMKSLLPLIALALIGGCGADFSSHFQLPPFKLFDKNNDGSFTEDEAGQLMVDAARVMTEVAGKKLFAGLFLAFPWRMGCVWNGKRKEWECDGKLTKEEYTMIELDARMDALSYLNFI